MSTNPTGRQGAAYRILIALAVGTGLIASCASFVDLYDGKGSNPCLPVASNNS